MTIEELRELKVTFCAGFKRMTFSIDETYNRINAVCLLLKWDGIEDAYEPGHVTFVYGRELIDKEFLRHLTAEDVKRRIRRLASSLIEHEMDESLKINGKRLCNPHPERLIPTRRSSFEK